MIFNCIKYFTAVLYDILEKIHYVQCSMSYCSVTASLLSHSQNKLLNGLGLFSLPIFA